jgi:hypothetical protein
MMVEPIPSNRSTRADGLARKETRLPVAFSCQLRTGSGPWRSASMTDLSCQGFRLAWLPECEPGRQLWVRIPGLEARTAMVRWRDDRGVGCEFLHPLHAAVIHFLSRATIRASA